MTEDLRKNKNNTELVEIQSQHSSQNNELRLKFSSSETKLKDSSEEEEKSGEHFSELNSQIDSSNSNTEE